MEEILIKPHHFLDILKLYGGGIEEFVPDGKYGHDFYKIGNLILGNKKVNLVLTTNCDDICKPCRFNKDGKCIDNISSGESKEKINQFLDKEILNYLEIEEGTINPLDLALASKEKIIPNIEIIWTKAGFRQELNENRKNNLIKGIDKYIGKND